MSGLPPTLTPPDQNVAETRAAGPHAGVVGRNFLALVSGEAAARVVAFGATIYIARALGPESYGAIAFALAVLLYLTRIADGGMEFFGLGVREIAEDRTRIESLAPDLLTARALIAGVLALLLLAASTLLPHPEGTVLALYGLTLLVVGINTRWILLGLEQTRIVAIARTMGETVVLLLVLLLVQNQADVAHVPVAQFAGDCLAALVLLFWLRRRGHVLRVRLRPAVVLPVFRRAAPLVASALLGLMIYNADLVFLRYFRGPAEVGYYAAAYTLISFLLNLGMAYSLTLLPAFTRLNQDTGARQDLYHTAMAQVFAITLPVAAGGALLAPQIMALVFGTTYAPSTPALVFLLWTIPLSLVRDVAIVSLVVNGRQGFVFRVTAWAASLNLVLNLMLVPRYGISGAVVATVVTEIARTGAAIAFARRDGLRAAGPARFWRTVAATGVMGGVVWLAAAFAVWAAIALGVLTYFVALTALGGMRFRRNELPELTV